MLRASYEEIVNKIKEEKGLSYEEIKSRVNKKLEQLSDLVSKEGAAHIIAHELGVRVFDLGKRKIKVKDLVFGLRNFEINVKVIAKYDAREFKKENRDGIVMNLLVGDETGSLRLVSWDKSQIGLLSKVNANDILRIKDCFVKENNGFKELHLRRDSKIEINPENEIIGDVLIGQSNKVKKIIELNQGENVSVLGTVVQLFEPRFYEACPECNRKLNLSGDKFHCAEHGIVKEKLNPILNFFLDDGSDNIRVVVFRENVSKLLNLNEAEILKLIGSDGFERIKHDFLGSQFVISGRVVKNDMFGRLELIANNFEKADAIKIANEMIKET